MGRVSEHPVLHVPDLDTIEFFFELELAVVFGFGSSDWMAGDGVQDGNFGTFGCIHAFDIEFTTSSFGFPLGFDDHRTNFDRGGFVPLIIVAAVAGGYAGYALQALAMAFGAFSAERCFITACVERAFFVIIIVFTKLDVVVAG